jgi:hypothetical protein
MTVIVNCFSLDRMISVGDDGQVVYRAESRPKGDGLPTRQQWSEAEWQFLMAL